MNTKMIKTSGRPKASSFKTSFLFFISLLFCSSTFAQDQFVWTGAAADGGLWTTPGNWEIVPKPSGAPYIATVYPGQVSPKNDVAIFINNGAPDCYMNKDCSMSPTALRVGGIIVKGYTGTITQINSNRFNVSAVNDAGGDELPDFTINVENPILGPADGMMAWQAHFEFGGIPNSSNGFQGNPASPGPLDYTLLFAVPLRLVTGTFKAPQDDTWVRHDMFVEPAAAPQFNNVYEGAIVLDNTNNGGGTRNYVLGGVHFWNLRIGSNGAVGIGAIKQFSGGTCIVENDFTTGGRNGVPGISASDAIVMNAPVGTEIHIKKDLIVGNKHATIASMVYAAADAYGDLFLVMNGDTVVQRIYHNEDALNFSGCLPSLRINKTVVGSFVELHGPTTVNNQLQLVSGLVVPNLSGVPTTQSDLGLANDMFVVNSNTSVSSTDISYCTGPIRARTGKTLELPLGKNIYRPAIISPVSGVSADNSQINLYTAEYFEASITALTPPSSFENPPLSLITNCEIWAIDKADDTSSDPWTFHLALSYDISSCSASLIYEDTCKVAVSRWDQSEFKWRSHGNDGVFPNASNGDQTIRTSLAIISPDFERSLPTSSTTPDLFTFGKLEESACITEPCDVDVCVDYCQVQDSFKFDPNIVYGPGSAPAGIFWDFGDGGTSTEDHPVHGFDSDGVYMVTVTVFAVSGGDTCHTVYTFGVFSNSCSLPSMGIRRSLNNNNNQTKTLKTSPSIHVEERSASLKVTPNPSSIGLVQFHLETEEKGNLDYMITNNLGQTILTGTITGNEKMTVNSSELAAGSYIISVQLLDKKVTQQFMILK